MNSKVLISLFVFYTFISCASPSASDEKEIAAEELVKEIEKGEDLLYNDITINGDLDLTQIVTGYPESKGVIRYDIQSSFAFVNCTFTGKIIGFRNDGTYSHVIRCLKNMAFINCIFQDEVILKEAVIYGAVNFGNSKFEKQAFFTNATFDFRSTYFNESMFKDKAHFQGILCKGMVNFMKAEFMGIAYFQNAEMEGIAQFSTAKFYQNTDFSLTTFKEGCIFNYVEFHGKAIFSSVTIEKRGDFIESIFKGTAIYQKVKATGEVKFTKSVFSQGLLLNDAVFYLYLPDIEGVVLENGTKIEQENVTLVSGNKINLEL